MKTRKEFFDKLQSDADFRSKYAEVTDEQKVLEMATADGYDLLANDPNMCTREDFLARMNSDAEFRAKYAGVTDEAQLLEMAAADGYDLFASDPSSEVMTEEELEAVAGGILSIMIFFGHFTTKTVPIVAKKIGEGVSRIVGKVVGLNKKQSEVYEKVMDKVFKD